MAGDARAVVLARVRAALGPAPAPAAVEVPRAYRQAGRALDLDAVVDRFCTRVEEYRARVHRIPAGSLDDVVAGLLAGRRVLVTAAPPCGVCGVAELRDDPPLTARELDTADAVLTGCALAVAETGTIVLDAPPSAGAARSRSCPTTTSASGAPGRSSSM